MEQGQSILNRLESQGLKPVAEKAQISIIYYLNKPAALLTVTKENLEYIYFKLSDFLCSEVVFK